MVVGLGMDIVEVGRIERAMKNPRFVERILTPREREFCTDPRRVAGRWAAKEAVYKAVGLPLGWQDIEILPDEVGSPRVRIVRADFDTRRLKIHVTITHERGHAAAVALLERMVYQARVIV
ncbi:holo-[acyl-carrier-protein] synthase [bacterium]|nr:MAG: holo-[acyl-carrier-protein] synthase [bacterium]